MAADRPAERGPSGTGHDTAGEIRKLLRRATYRNLHALITLYGVPKTHRHAAYMLLRKELRRAR